MTPVDHLIETFTKHYGKGWLIDPTIKKKIEDARRNEAQKFHSLRCFWYGRGILAGRENRIHELKPVLTELPEEYEPAVTEHTVDEKSYTITDGETTARLPKRTFQLALYLYKNKPRLITRQEIYDHIWKDMIVEERTIDVHIRKIRNKIPNVPITTVKGVGYQWE